MRACVLGFKDQNFKSIFLISSVRLEDRPPPLHSPAHDTFDGTDVLSLQVVVLPQGAGSLVERCVLALQAAQGLAEPLVLRVRLLGVRRARHQPSPGTTPRAAREHAASPAFRQGKAAPSRGLGCTCGPCASSKGLFLYSDLNLGASLLANRKMRTPVDAVPAGN